MNRQEYIEKLEELKLPKDQFIILYGGSLLMHGLRETTSDFDLCITKELAEKIDLYKAPKDDKGFFVPFRNFQVLDNFDEYKYDEIDGYKCQDLKEILDFKRKLMREKDLKDIAKIEEFI